MGRIPHGRIVTADLLTGNEDALGLMFPDLQDDPANLLPESAATVAALKKLAETMGDFDGQTDVDNSPIPAAYTYFGQFVDHDIILEIAAGAETADPGGIFAPDATPIPLDLIGSTLRNGRNATLDLDNLYSAPAPRDLANPAKLVVGNISELGNQEFPNARPAGKGVANDVLREPRSNDPDHDRAALIGDARDDENLIISQLHVAFLKTHNRLIDDGYQFDAAQRTLRRHYQWIIVEDYLKRVADPDIVQSVLDHGNTWFDPFAEPFVLPLEFTAAAFRFGHTMVRPEYDYNINFRTRDDTNPNDFPGSATLDLLFSFTALSGQLGGGPGPDDPNNGGSGTLPENWIIEWERIIGDHAGAAGHARRFDTRLASLAGGRRSGLFDLQAPDGTPEKGLAAMLSARNLLRGYRLRIPTGQAVAAHLKLPVLDPDRLRAAVGTRQAAELAAAGLLERTPLWYYLLAEANSYGGARLGPLGSTIVAEVLVGLVRRSTDSILSEPGWTPSLPSRTPGRFELADLLRYAGVLPDTAPTRVYRINPGDTLTDIAETELLDVARWTEIFAANRNTVRNPDHILAGATLILPGGPAVGPPPRFHRVVARDTCETIAGQELGDRTRWREILDLNGDVVTNPDVLTTGDALALPPG